VGSVGLSTLSKVDLCKYVRMHMHVHTHTHIHIHTRSPVGRELTAAGNVGLLVLNFVYIIVSWFAEACTCVYVIVIGLQKHTGAHWFKC